MVGALFSGLRLQGLYVGLVAEGHHSRPVTLVLATITPLTRRRIVTELDSISLSGGLEEVEFLKKIWPIDKLPSPSPRSSEPTMEDYIFRHRIRNPDDMSNTEMLEALGIYTCSQKNFFRFLEVLVHPVWSKN